MNFSLRQNKLSVLNRVQIENACFFVVAAMSSQLLLQKILRKVQQTLYEFFFYEISFSKKFNPCQIYKWIKYTSGRDSGREKFLFYDFHFSRSRCCYKKKQRTFRKMKESNIQFITFSSLHYFYFTAFFFEYTF